MTVDEFHKYNKLGRHSPGVLAAKVTSGDRELLEEPIPDEVNWVDQGAVVPVKNQLMCGSCWAFSAICAIEGAHFLDTGELTSLSEQELVDCDPLDLGCGGGL